MEGVPVKLIYGEQSKQKGTTCGSLVGIIIVESVTNGKMNKTIYEWVITWCLWVQLISIVLENKIKFHIF